MKALLRSVWVELGGEKRLSRLQDLVGPAQFAPLAAERLQLLALLGFGLPHPLTQRLVGGRRGPHRQPTSTLKAESTSKPWSSTPPLAEAFRYAGVTITERQPKCLLPGPM